VRDRHGETALMKAARLGNYPVVKLLIEFGADVHAIDEKGGTALGYASKFGQEEVADLLKTHGAVH
jgi:ankyrin repeat protein